MAFEVWKQDSQLAEFIVLIVFSPIGISVTALRFVATRRGARSPGLEDWLAAVAAFFFLMVNFANLMGKSTTSTYNQLNMANIWWIAITTLNGRDVSVAVAKSPSDYKMIRMVCGSPVVSFLAS